jgi:hypothetical protein
MTLIKKIAIAWTLIACGCASTSVQNRGISSVNDFSKIKAHLELVGPSGSTPKDRMVNGFRTREAFRLLRQLHVEPGTAMHAISRLKQEGNVTDADKLRDAVAVILRFGHEEIKATEWEEEARSRRDGSRVGAYEAAQFQGQARYALDYILGTDLIPITVSGEDGNTRRYLPTQTVDAPPGKSHKEDFRRLVYDYFATVLFPSGYDQFAVMDYMQRLKMTDDDRRFAREVVARLTMMSDHDLTQVFTSYLPSDRIVRMQASLPAFMSLLETKIAE